MIMTTVNVEGPQNVLAQLLATLEEKPHSSIVAVVSVTNGKINNTTVTVEGAETEHELVVKTFRHYDGIMDASRQMAAEGGFPTDSTFPPETPPGKPK
jgi:hypothetical protein